jgi:hypothetical protein
MQFFELRLAGCFDGCGVENPVKLVEPVTQLGSLDVQDLDIGHRAALVVVDHDHVAVGGDVVRGLEPVGIASDLTCSGVGGLV